MFCGHFFNKLNVVCHGILLRHAFPAEPRVVFGLTLKVKHARLVYVDIAHRSLLVKPIKVLKVKVNSKQLFNYLKVLRGRGFRRNRHFSVTVSSVFESVALILFLMSSAACKERSLEMKPQSTSIIEKFNFHERLSLYLSKSTCHFLILIRTP